jgi:hypothetical protein
MSYRDACSARNLPRLGRTGDVGDPGRCNSDRRRQQSAGSSLLPLMSLPSHEHGSIDAPVPTAALMSRAIGAAGGAPDRTLDPALGPNVEALPPAIPRSPLARSVDGVYLPSWFASLGCPAIRQRSNRLAVPDHSLLRLAGKAGRVHDRRRARRSRSCPLRSPIRRIELRRLTLGTRRFATWRGARYTCVLPETAVTTDALERQAAGSDS